MTALRKTRTETRAEAWSQRLRPLCARASRLHRQREAPAEQVRRLGARASRPHRQGEAPAEPVIVEYYGSEAVQSERELNDMSANDHDTNNESHGPADALGYGFRALVAKLHDQILVYTLAAAVLLVLAALVLPKGVRAPVFVGVGVLVLVGVVAWLYGRNQDTAERASGMRSGDIAIGRGVEVGPGAEVGSGDIHGSSDIHGPIETGDVTLRAGDRIQGTVRSGSVDVGGAHRPHSSTKRDGTPDDPSATS